MPSNLVWSWPLHLNSNISYVCMEKDGLNCKRGHAIIGFNHGLPCYVKNMALGPQSRQKPRPTASVFVYLSPSGHVFNIAWQAMIKTYTTFQAIPSMRSLGNARKPQIWPVLLSQNSAKITKINKPWPRANQFCTWSRYISIQNFRPFPPCVVQIMPGNPKFDPFH